MRPRTRTWCERRIPLFISDLLSGRTHGGSVDAGLPDVGPQSPPIPSVAACSLETDGRSFVLFCQFGVCPK
jgi:hypothetical protein